MRLQNDLLLLFLTVISAGAQQPRYFVGGGPGISILSGASGASVGPTSAAVSNYEPKIGAEVHAFGGWHPWQYLSFQGSWSANRNALTFNATTSANGFFRQQRTSSQQNIGADALLYFRERRSHVRPFLSAGVNYMWFKSTPSEVSAAAGSLVPPPAYESRAAGLRVAAGTDILHRSGWGFRYAFMEHLQQRNVIGLRLTPAAHRQLMNFQHIFGVVKYF